MTSTDYRDENLHLFLAKGFVCVGGGGVRGRGRGGLIFTERDSHP